MSEFKGTQEEWGIENDSVCCYDYANSEICKMSDAFGYEITKANQRLISYAPEMLDMLKSCVLAFDQIGMKKPAGISELIKKATTI